MKNLFVWIRGPKGKPIAEKRHDGGLVRYPEPLATYLISDPREWELSIEHLAMKFPPPEQPL